MTEEEGNKMEKDILFQIDMQLYDEFNDKLCEMNDNLGTIYTYKDIMDLEEAEKDKERKLLREAIKKLQSDIEIKDKVINRTCKYINEAKIMNKAIPVYPNKVDTPYTVGVASIEEIKQHFYEEVEKENE